MTSLEELRKINARCIHCRACQYAYANEPDKEGESEEFTGMLLSCPSGNLYGWEGYFNSGRMWIARAFLNKEIEASQEMLEVLEACTTCGLCAEQCPNLIDTVEIIEELRAAIIDAGIEPLAKHKRFGEMVGDPELKNPYKEPRAERTKWFEGVVDNPDAKVAYFVGCTGAYRQQVIADKTTKILEKLGLDYTVVSGEVCCGSPILRTGMKPVFMDVMNENLEVFKDFDLLVFSCAGCYKTFRNDYVNHSGKELPFKVRHTVELAYDLISEGKLKIEKPYNRKVTWHDPCHSVRHVGLAIEKEILNKSENWLLDSRAATKAKQAHYNIPRIVLKAIPGLELIEMYRIKGDSFCCGAGGGVKAQFPDMAIKTSLERLREAASTGADVLMTSCPFCVTNFNDGIKALKKEEEATGKDLSNLGSKLEVVELLEVLDELL